MGDYMYWYRVEYRESFWDTENTLRRVAYISAPENATLGCGMDERCNLCRVHPLCFDTALLVSSVRLP